jgi:hypothetical protein
MEPNELANAPADRILAALPGLSPNPIGQMQLFEKRTPYLVKRQRQPKQK